MDYFLQGVPSMIRAVRFPRRLFLFCLVSLVGVMSSSMGAHAQVKKEIQIMNAQIRDRLTTPMPLEKGFDPNTPLGDVLDYLGALKDVRIIVDHKAFAGDLQVKNIGSQPVQLPPQKDIAFGDVLDLILQQVKGGFLVQSGQIVVTTAIRSNPMRWKKEGFDRRKVPTVDAAFDKRPFDEALLELSNVSGIWVVLDEDIKGRRARFEVTAKFKGVPIDTAVQDLCGPAKLRCIAMENGLYVTTQAQAKVWEQK
jgi:hypothetical protein